MTLVDEMTKGQQPVGTAQKNNPPLAPVGPYLHGSQGLFNRRDRENPIFAAMMLPEAGVADALPVFNGARYLNNEFGGTDWAFDSLITGQTAGNLDNKANQSTQPCDDGPAPGFLQYCTIANESGNYKMSTNEVQQYRAGRVEDNVDAMTAQVANIMPSSVFGTPTSTPSLQNAVSNELAARIWEMITGFQRMFYPQVFTGSPANNAGEYREIVGLDLHINTGHRDARMNVTCPAADSDVKSFGSSVVGAANGRDIMRYIEMCDAYVTNKARRQGFGTPEYIIAMRPEAWFEISEVIPVQKYERVIRLVNNVTNGRAVLDASGALDERNQIRASMLIPVNGRFIRVVIDDTIAETNLGNLSGIPTYSSTIYGIPLTVLGGYPVTFWEYFNHDNAQSRAIQQVAQGLTWTTDGGLFRWYSNFKNGCLKLNAQFTPRLRMRTPQLAWRIDSVAYQPLQHFADWNPSGSYFQDGGVTTGENSKYYATWATSTPVSA